jgi:oxygen-dependent protoporphyrinogen oxidase
MATALAIEDLARQRGAAAPELLVLEAEPHVGGKIRTLQEEGFTCEWGVNGFLNKEPRTLELVQRLGLEQRLLPATAAFKRRYIYTRGKLRSVQMHPLKFLFSGLLPFSAKLRLIRELWVPRRPADQGDESVADFARRRVGPVAYRVLVDPMQTGIYAGDPEQMSVLSSFPRVVEVEQQHGSLIRGMKRIAAERRAEAEARGEQAPDQLPGAGPAGHLTSFEGGMQVLVERLAQVLGQRVRTGAPVQAVERQGRSFRVRLEGQSLEAEAVVLACPAHASRRLLGGLDGELSGLLSQIPYAPLAVVCLGFSAGQLGHPMDGFGYLVPRDAGLRLLGVLWTSTIFPGRAPDGRALLRVMIGGARDPGALELSDDQLLQAVLQDLARAQGVRGEPCFARVFRHQRAIPGYTVGHAERLQQMGALERRHPGLVITGNAYRGVSVNDCAREAWPTAERVLNIFAQG